MKRYVDISLTLLALLAVCVITVTFSIGLPIYCRSFYYMQIEPLGIEERCGLDRQTIIEGYDEVLDYLTRPGTEFSAGVFKFTDRGAAHFADCKGLFTLNTVGFVVSAVLLIGLSLLYKKRRWKPIEILGLPFYAVSGIATLSFFALLAAVVLFDFTAAFSVFHKIFFPGKENYKFDPRFEEIILALPAQFFMNCAILIGTSVILISAVLIAAGFIVKKKNKKRSHPKNGEIVFCK